MTAILIEPHYDDAVLFACYTLLEERPLVATVFGRPEEVTSGIRLEEHREAMRYLDLDPAYLLTSDRSPKWDKIKAWLTELRDEIRPARVYAPAFEEGGHEQHNEVSEIVNAIFTTAHIDYYMTYRRGSGRSRGSMEIEPAPGWPAIKLRAMSYYASQIEWIHTRPWFAADDALREWLA